MLDSDLADLYGVFTSEEAINVNISIVRKFS